MVDLIVAQRGMKLGMVDLTVAQRGMKIGDDRFDFCTERYDTREWWFDCFTERSILGDSRYDCCTERYETRGWQICLLHREV